MKAYDELTGKEYQELTVQEQARFLTHSTAELTEKLFYGKDKTGLEAVIRSLDFLADYARNCVSCLEFVGDGKNPYRKIELLLGYLGQEGISEKFVSELEDITEEAQRYLETGDCEDEEQQKEAESSALENMRKLLDEAEKRAALEAEVELGA